MSAEGWTRRDLLRAGGRLGILGAGAALARIRRGEAPWGACPRARDCGGCPHARPECPRRREEGRLRG